MVGYQVQKMEVRGQALVAWVRYTRADGAVKEERLGWPSSISRTEIEQILEKRFQDFLAEVAVPPSVHEAMALVGQAEDLSYLDPGATSSKAL
jgi:hypothetical protein